MNTETKVKLLCADCGFEIGDDSPSDGWQMEDGRTVCHTCCSIGFGSFVDFAITLNKQSPKLKH